MMYLKRGQRYNISNNEHKSVMLPRENFHKMRITKYQLYQIFLFTLLPILNLQLCESAKILAIFPYVAKSHFIFNSAVLKSLSDVGHEITVITSFPLDVTSENITIIDTSALFEIQVGNTTYNEFSNRSSLSVSNFASGHETPVCHKFWELKEIQDFMNSDEKLFDVIFIETFYLYKCYCPIARKMNIPIIGTITYKSWIPVDMALKNPNNPAYMAYDSGDIEFEHTSFRARLQNTWDHMMVYLYQHFINHAYLGRFHKTNLQHFVSYDDFMSTEPSLIFLNSHHSYICRPKNPNVIEIAGIHIKPLKPLPKKIQKFIDEASDGVILFSFGSLVRASSMPTKTVAAFLEAFAEIPQRVIMKFEQPLNNPPKNVLILRWLPQRDILEHENVKAFISHCGQGGVYEAIYTATPVVACPLMFDQPTNAAILLRARVAVHLNIEVISKEIVLNALNKIINDTSYRENMRRLSLEFKDRPMTPQQSVVYWTNYIIRHNGAPHLKTAATDLHWFQYLLLDILCFVITIVIVTITLFYYTVKLLIRVYSMIIIHKENGKTAKHKSI